MILNIQKFKREIVGLKRLKPQSELHPLSKAAIKQRVMAEIASPSFVAVATPALRAGFLQRITHYLAPIGAGVLFFAGTVMASGGAMPGDKLYPVKQAKEQAEFKLAPGETAKAKVQAKHAEERIKELKHILVSEPQKEELANQTAQSPDDSTPQLDGAINATSAPLPEKKLSKNFQENKKTRVFRDQAKTQYKEAMAALKQAKRHSEEKGDIVEAKNLTQNISQLKDKAKLIELEDDDEKKPTSNTQDNDD